MYKMLYFFSSPSLFRKTRVLFTGSLATLNVHAHRSISNKKKVLHIAEKV